MKLKEMVSIRIEKIGRGMRFTKRAVRADLHRLKAYAEMNEA